MDKFLNVVIVDKHHQCSLENHETSAKHMFISLKKYGHVLLFNQNHGNRVNNRLHVSTFS